jgi:hypothetical protein
MSQIQLHADAALNAMADAGLKPADIDGVATAGETPVTITHYPASPRRRLLVHDPCPPRRRGDRLGPLRDDIDHAWRHGESGRSGVRRTRNVVAPASLAGQFEQPYGPMGPPTLFTVRVLRYMMLFRRSRESGGLEPAPGLNRGASDRAREPWVPASAGTTR